MDQFYPCVASAHHSRDDSASRFKAALDLDSIPTRSGILHAGGTVMISTGSITYQWCSRERLPVFRMHFLPDWALTTSKILHAFIDALFPPRSLLLLWKWRKVPHEWRTNIDECHCLSNVPVVLSCRSFFTREALSLSKALQDDLLLPCLITSFKIRARNAT